MRNASPDPELRTLPGHCVRRVHQLSVALFSQEVGDLGLTQVQFSALQTVCKTPGIDQKTLAQAIGFDTSTLAGVIDRMEARGLVQRNVSPHDRRARLITPTEAGRLMLREVMPHMLRVQERLLEPLSPAEREVFMQLMHRVIDANADLSGIPAKE